MQKSANLSVYEVQLLDYMRAFHIPQDYQARILEYQGKLEAAYSDAEDERSALESRLKRLRELYEWGDYTRAEYQGRRDEVFKQLEALSPSLQTTDHLDRLADFLADVSSAWQTATQEQRNKLARALFDQVWVKDKIVVGVKPRPELEPFFRLNYEDSTKENIEGGTQRRVELHREHELPVLLAA